MSYSSSSSVPIEMLPGIGKRTAKVLRSWNIATIGQFIRMPEPVLTELFGPSIRTVYYGVLQKRTVEKSARPKMKPISEHTQRPTLNWSQKFRLASQLFML